MSKFKKFESQEEFNAAWKEFNDRFNQNLKEMLDQKPQHNPGECYVCDGKNDAGSGHTMSGEIKIAIPFDDTPLKASSPIIKIMQDQIDALKSSMNELKNPKPTYQRIWGNDLVTVCEKCDSFISHLGPTACECYDDLALAK